MSVPEVLFIVGLIVGIIEVGRSRGYNLLAWGLLAVAAGLLWDRLV